MIIEKKPERDSITGVIVLAYLNRYGYPLLLLAAALLADKFRGELMMLTVLSVGIFLLGVYDLAGYLLRWKHIYLSYQSMYHRKMIPTQIEWDRLSQKDAYGVPATFIAAGLIGGLVSIFLR